ncbi:MAG: isoprenylcysteine carboxylmethyltransferase family protein [Salaquimonas sp.]|nr:isoprenylcysteine carboxylmethyltransferase family protein [Salaquimonas sp.]
MIALLAMGLIAAACLLAILIWSLVFPRRRIWPPGRITFLGETVVWGLTLVAFASALFLGLADWNGLGWPALPRWGVGLPLVVVANLVVWSGVFKIGVAATSGAKNTLETDGLYAWSRNPQYVADMVLFAGWVLWSASLWVMPVAAAGIVVLVTACFAEEPWLEESYGEAYRAYRSRVRRFL